MEDNKDILPGNTNDDANTQTKDNLNAGRTFTQEEVNGIIKERLSKERDKVKREQDALFAEREKKIADRELRMAAVEKLQEKGLSTTLADAINCSSDESIEKSIEILMQAYKNPVEGKAVSYVPAYGGESLPDPIRAAMGL